MFWILDFQIRDAPLAAPVSYFFQSDAYMGIYMQIVHKLVIFLDVFYIILNFNTNEYTLSVCVL